MESQSDTDHRPVDQWRATPSLEAFSADDLITDVIRPIKSGKEATLYCCRAHPTTGVNLLAAKVYKLWVEPDRKRDNRTDDDLRATDRHAHESRSSFHNRSIYEEGRHIDDARLCRALANGSAAGRRVRFGSWVDREFAALCRLSDAGASVPVPVARSGPAILMEYLGDEDAPAPTLKRAALTEEEARAAFEEVMRNVELFLAHDLVHADLSAFNILYWRGRPTIIDFPQAVDAFDNPNARSLLSRDIYNVCRFFARRGVDEDPGRCSDLLWERFLKRELAP